MGGALCDHLKDAVAAFNSTAQDEMETKMIVTERQADLIEASFAEVAKLGPAAGELFYKRLFQTAPGVRDMFPADTSGQARKLTMALAMVVQNIRNFDGIAPTVTDLARRHVDYGVLPEHYDVVGQVLLAVLEEALAERFTDETEEAWATAYGALAGHMIATSYDQAA